MLGDDFPGVDHAPEDSRLPHSVTRGAGRIMILRAKANNGAVKAFLLPHLQRMLSITTPRAAIGVEAVTPGCRCCT